MNKLLLFILMLGNLSAHSQAIPDSVLKQYHAATTIPQQTKALGVYFNQVNDRPVSIPQKIAELTRSKAFFITQHDAVAADLCTYAIANYYRLNSDFSIALQNILPVLKNFEQRNDTTSIIRCLTMIGSCFTNAENIQQGLLYNKKCEPLARSFGNPMLYAGLLNNMADCYNKMRHGDSALPYIQQAINLSLQFTEAQKKITTGTLYSTMGQTYLVLGDKELARVYFKKGVASSIVINERRTIANAQNSLSESFFTSAQYDSSILFARQALQAAQPDYKKQVMTAYEWLYKNFDATAVKDSANKYFRLATFMKDSIFTGEKNRAMQVMDFQEQLRQQELKAEQLQLVTERKMNIQYALIGLGIVLLVGLFLLLSRSFITNTKVIDVFGIIALLLVFEFLNLLLHPFLERVTHHSPILMLLALVCLAAILAPLHHRLEKWATKKLVAKNKAIRLAAAKKTIAALEQTDSKHNKE